MTNLEAAEILGKMHKCGDKGCPVEIDVPCEECPYNVTDEQGEEAFLFAIEAFRNQSEIIHCTECKHYREYDSKYIENAVVVQCMADRYPISEIIPDGWFCAGAERRTNE